jgi:putative membrane protein
VGSPVLIVKTLHVVFVVTWFAGLFYLPRLFVYHATATDAISIERFKLMERRLLRGIMMPSMLAAIVFGTWLWLGYGIGGGWLHLKLLLVLAAIGYQHLCRRLLRDFEHAANRRSHRWFRLFNEASVLLFAAIVVLVVVKPF